MPADAKKQAGLKINLSKKGILIGLMVFLSFEAFLLLFVAKVNKPQPPKVEQKSVGLYLEPAEGSFAVNQEFEVKVILDTGDFATDATDVRLDFDPAVLEVSKVTPGQIYDDYPAKRIDSANGVVVINGITSLTKTFKGRDTFATLTVKGLKKGKAVLLLEFSPGATNDSNVVATKIAKDVLSEVEGAGFEFQ